MSQCPFGGDGEFSFERFADAYNSGLANNLGNLYSRILTMCVKYFDGRLDGARAGRRDAVAAGARLRRRSSPTLRGQIGSFEYNVALQRIWRDVVDAANRYIQETEPFKLAKTDLAACRAVLVNLADWLRVDGDPDQAVPAAHGRDVLPGLQLRGDDAVGPGQLRRCAPAAEPGGPARHRAARRRQAGAAVPQG